jgi:hypothetical protein
MKNLTKCSGWCPPTVIYIVLAVTSTIISLFVTNHYDNLQNQGANKVLYAIIHLVGFSFWTWVLYWLCSNCHQTAAWVVLLFPILLFFALIIVALASGVLRKVNLQNIRYEYQRS